MSGIEALKPNSGGPGSEGEPAPRHVAIIMDGNGRWAMARGLPRTAGHRRGAEAVRTAVRGAIECGVPYLTLFGFSAENWKRPADEVRDLMGLLRFYLRNEVEELNSNGVRLRVIGARDRLDKDIVAEIERSEARTATNTRLNLALALDYGGRQEIVRAARALAEESAAGRLDPASIDEALLNDRLFTSGMPEPDLLIRTGGEKRISNFLLWQCAYAELVFLDLFWPDFAKPELERAIQDFRGRERRWGTVR